MRNPYEIPGIAPTATADFVSGLDKFLLKFTR